VYCTILHYICVTVRYCIALNCIVLHCTHGTRALYSSTCTVSHSIILHVTSILQVYYTSSLYCTATLHCAALHCPVCITRYCTVQPTLYRNKVYFTTLHPAAFYALCYYSMLHIVLHVAATMPYTRKHCRCMHSSCAHLHSTLTQNTQPVARSGCLNILYALHCSILMLCTHLSYTSTLCVATTAANNARCSTDTTTAAYCRSL